MKVLIIVAHPDDAEISMGMKIQEHVSKHDEVFIHCISKGGNKGEELKAIRVHEAIEAGKILNINNYSFSDITDSDFESHRVKIRTVVEQLVKEINPDIVYTHFYKDMHTDHMVVAEEVLIGSRSVPTLKYFRSPYSVEMLPNEFFFGDQELIKLKEEAIKKFESQKQIDISVLKKFSSVVYFEYLHPHLIQKIMQCKKTQELYVEFFSVVRQIEV